MATIKEYLTSYQHTFFEKPWNEVDNLICASFSYLNFTGIVPGIGKDAITIKEAYQKYESMKLSADQMIAKIPSATFRNFSLMAKSKRYCDVKLSSYIRILGENIQFGAICLILPSGEKYVSFEGTDDSVVGWKEDFALSYEYPVPAQKEAIHYLNKVVSIKDSTVYVGGHSKGGHLAMCASMKCLPWIKLKIKAVYNNDGPGFRLQETKKRDYRQMLKKLHMYVPCESVVGMLLSHPNIYTVVKSKAWGVMQHDATTWLVDYDHFAYGERTILSRELETRLSYMIDHMDDAKRKHLTNAIFDLFLKSGIDNIYSLIKMRLPVMINLVKGLKHVNKEEKEFLITTFSLLLSKKQLVNKE